MGVVHIPAPSCAPAHIPFSLGLCLPQHASLLCLASFVAASKYGCAIGFVGNACEGCVRGFGMGVVHITAPSCALADLLFSFGLCLPATCFSPILWFLCHRK